MIKAIKKNVSLFNTLTENKNDTMLISGELGML